MMKIFSIICMILLSMPMAQSKSIDIAALTRELNILEKQNLFKGKMILKERHIADFPWPVVTIYSIVNTSPLEATAIFAAYPTQMDYVPNMKSSRPVKHASATDVHVEYIIDLPWPIPDSKFITGNKVSKLQENTYKVEWYLVRSNSTYDNRGEVIYIPYQGKTLMKYRTFVHPKSFFAGLFKGTMINDVRESLDVIIKHIEKTKNSPAEMDKWVSYITGALEGKMVYQKENQP